jgi:hypothetical protein
MAVLLLNPRALKNVAARALIFERERDKSWD